jgi:predicted small lipoprotein YifL
VKSYLDLPRATLLASAMMALTLMSGCGQRGPLYLPGKADSAPAIPDQNPIPTSTPDDGDPALSK